jgi:chaperone required for assembly of F1-ATPase
MKRFWTDVQVATDGEQFIVRLDGRPVKLPSGKPLAVPFQALADGIAAEWAATGQNFTPDDLPLTRLATTAQERVRAHRGDIITQLAAYGMNDLLCYRATDQPALALREEAVWQPWLDWAERQWGIALHATAGIVPIAQSLACHEVFMRHLSGMDEYQLAGLGVIVPALGSLVLALAVEAGALAPGAACECAHLGELWQEERWGKDEAAAARRQSVTEDVAVSARFMILCRA